MTHRTLLALVAALSLSAASVAAAEPAGEAGTAATTATTDAAPPKHKSGRDPNEVVCKTTEVIGTRLGAGRICKTRAEWAQTRRDAHDATDEAQRNAQYANPKGN